MKEVAEHEKGQGNWKEKKEGGLCCGVLNQ